VQRGYVKLAGVLPTRRDLARVEELVGRIQGVRSIETAFNFARQPAEPDQAVKSRLQARLNAAFPEADLSVSVFSGMAVISGSVRQLSIKHGAVRLVREDDDVQRVLDAVQVT